MAQSGWVTRPVIELMRRRASNPQDTWLFHVFSQLRTRRACFVFLCTVLCHITESLVTSKFLGYKRQEVNSAIPLVLLPEI